MRVSLAAFFIAVCAASFVSAEPVTSLERKPGLWSIEMVVDDDRERATMEQCVDAQTDARMLQMAGQMGADCSKNQLSKSGSSYTYESVCKVSGSTMRAKGLFKGDFGSRYEGTIDATIEPPLFGHSRSSTKIVGVWKGQCPAGMKPGDMAMPNGMKVSLEQAQQSARMAAQLANNPEMAQLMNNMKGLEGGAQAIQDAVKQLGQMGGR
jgi:hypothetical protein